MRAAPAWRKREGGNLHAMLISAEIDSSLFCQGLGGVAVSFLLRCAVRTMPVRVCRDMCGMMGLDFRAFFFSLQ
jgi:hypothetical protein